MFPLLMPALIGAGIGGGVNLLRGKNPLKGALLGGLGGAATGGLSNYLSTGSVLGASTVGQNVANAAMAGAGEAPFAGAVFNPATGTWINPDYFVGATTGIPLYTGGQGLLSNAYDMASAAIPEELKNQITPQNMYGVASLLQQQSQAPRISGGGGGVQSGGAVKYEPLSTVSIPTRTRRKIG